MKIRTQLSFLIIVLIILPVLCLTSLPVYHYMTSNQRYLMKGYKEIRSLGNFNLPEEDWDLLRQTLEQVPPNVQVAAFYENTILVSNIPELKAGISLDFFNLVEFISNTSSYYDYQVQAPVSTDPSKKDYKQQSTKKHSRLIVISRTKVSDPMERKSWSNRIYSIIFIFVFIFEAFCLTIIMKLSKTITSSITMLEKNTSHIANGELEYELIRPKKDRFSNEITNLTENLDKMRLSLKDDQERRSKFIMGLSHDLRTPVALIKGYSEAISDGVVNNHDEIIKSINIIHTKADQLENMINDLINYMKLNTAEWFHTLDFINIQPVLEEFAEGCNLTSDVYKRSIHTNVSISPDIKIRMDQKLFLRALENLFSNALRYTKEGDSIYFSALEEDNKIIINVKDTGCGIQQKDLSHIFDTFYRGSNSRREPGMGIGLSVVKNIIDTHGWNICVESEQDKGTTFTITIPKEVNE